MGKTPIYGLGYIEPGMRVGEQLDLDELRFLAIEAQLYGMATLFGNGVIESDDDDSSTVSWQLQNVPGSTTQIVVTAGRGYVEWKSAVTTNAVTLDLPAPTGAASGVFTYWVYARPNATTAAKRTVDFIVSTVEIQQPDVYIGLGGVTLDTTQSPSVLTCHNTAAYGRVVINLFASLARIINRHKHIGGSNNPPQIDLGRHVQGKLSGDFISDIDLARATKGTLAPERLPVIDHNTLTRRGTLTHPQIDTLLASLQGTPEGYRLFDLATANTLQTVLGLKRITSPNLSLIDKNLINAILLIPGISPSSFRALDVPASINQATYDTVNKQIVGTLTTTPKSDTLVWTTRDDFQRALNSAATRTVAVEPISKNLVIQGTGVGASLVLGKPLEYRGIAGTSLTDWKIGYIFDDESTQNGSFTDAFRIQRFFYLPFGTAQDWSSRTTLGLGFSIDAPSQPGRVYCYLIVSSGGTSTTVTSPGGQSTTFSISAPTVVFDDEAGESPQNVYREIPLDTFALTTAQLQQIAGIGFYWDSDEGWDKQDVVFSLEIPSDDQISTVADPDPAVIAARQTLPDSSTIFIWNEYKYASEGVLVFRFDSSSVNTRYNLVNWDVALNGGAITVETRAANTESALAQKFTVDSSTHLVDTRSSQGRWFDIIVTIRPSVSLLQTPVLNSLWLAFDSIGVSYNKVWDKRESDLSTNQTGWLTGELLENILIGPDVVDGNTKNYLTIESTSGIGQFRYLRQNNAYQAFNVDGSDESIFLSGMQNTAVPYVAPVQAWKGGGLLGFYQPRDMQVMSNGNTVLADTGNDRLIELDGEGEIVRIIQGNIRLNQKTRDFAALTAAYNPRTGALYVAFSQNVKITDPSKCLIVNGTNVIRFNDTGVNAIPFNPINSASATLIVTFSADVKARIDGWIGGIEVVLMEGSVEIGATSGGGGGGGGNDDDPELPEGYYEVVGTGSLAGKLEAKDGLPDYSESDEDSTDFDGDGSITTVLQGPGGQKQSVTLKVYIGEVVYDNLFAPISVQVTEAGHWIVATAGSESVIAFGTGSDRLWTLPSTLVGFVEGKGGSAYELDNGNVLVGAPAPTSGGGGILYVINRNNNVPVVRIRPAQDVVRAVPYGDMEYYALLDDVAQDGANSRLVRYNTAGRITWAWGLGTLVHPTGLKSLASGMLLVSE